MILKNFRYTITSTKPNFPIFHYPFDYTFSPQQFKFKDKRFQEYPVTQKLYPAEHNHIKYVLQLFEEYLNKGTITNQTKEYIHERLLNNVLEYKQLLRDNQMRVEFRFDSEKCNESKGYAQFYGLKPNLSIHQYILQKNEEKVMLIEKQELRQIAKKTAEEQLKQDMEQIRKENSIGEKIKEKIFKDKSKKSELAFKIADFFQQSYENSKKKKAFEKYILVNRIDGMMSLKIHSDLENKTKSEQIKNIDLTTKWLYEVEREESQSIQKSRKRQLFDFQLWNRGSFIPVKDFTLL